MKTVVAVPLSQHFRALLTHEYLTSSFNSTQQVSAGVEGTTNGGTNAYTRYAMDRTGNDDRMGAVSGIRQRLQLSPTLSATAGVEGFVSISGRDADEYVSLTTGLSSRVPGKHFIDGTKLKEGMLNRVSALVRCYDPCLSCSTHAIGTVPLQIQLFSPEGEVLDEQRS